MRRLSPALWILAPLAAGLVYAGGHALFAPQPTLADVVPKAAVITARFRGLAALDELWFFPRAGDVRPSEFLSAQRNLPGLAGVAPGGPVHFVLLPARGRPDPSLLILPVEDADALRARYEGRDLPEAAARGLERNPHQLEIRGDHAALAWDREIVRHLGEGGVTLDDRGEDMGLALDVPGALLLALTLGGESPWRPLLEALGARPAETTFQADAATGVRRPVYPAGRTPRVGAAWRTARLWAWRARGEVQIELAPADPALTSLLGAVLTAPTTPVHGRAGAAATLEIPSSAARRALQAILEAAGLDVPPPTKPPHDDTPGIAVTAWPNQGTAHAWTLALEPFGGTSLPSLGDLLGDTMKPGEARDFAPGALPVTIHDRRGGMLSPAAKLLRPKSPDDQRLLLGAEAEARAQSVPPPAPPLALPLASGEAVIARLSLSAPAAAGLLGGALPKGGLLHVLEGGPLEALLSTDGTLVKLRLVRSR